MRVVGGTELAKRTKRVFFNGEDVTWKCVMADDRKGEVILLKVVKTKTPGQNSFPLFNYRFHPPKQMGFGCLDKRGRTVRERFEGHVVIEMHPWK